GHDVTRVLLRRKDGFVLDPALVPDDADLVIVGNPTNPTGVLHPGAALRALARPGRVLVVDEAFMDAVPGESESLAGASLPGVVVVRSLTKTWAIPGIRAGYVLGDESIVAELAAHQPPWSVSTPAAAAMIACASPAATVEAERIAVQVAADRTVLVDGLTALGIEVTGPSAAPFVLAHVPVGTRERLRGKGFAVRRGDSFPGLGADWVRIAVRDAQTTEALLGAWRGLT
ncbi:cobyrinic acid a,c-diamide synthase, partial [Rhodococcus rhodochrous]